MNNQSAIHGRGIIEDHVLGLTKISQLDLNSLKRNSFSHRMFALSVALVASMATAIIIHSGYSGYQQAHSSQARMINEVPTGANSHEQVTKAALMGRKLHLSEVIASKYKLEGDYALKVVNSVFLESHKADLEPELVLGLIGVESSFKKNSRSGYGAQGLTQVVKRVWKSKFEHIKGDTTIEDDVRIGVEILKEYKDKSKGNLRLALQKYNGTAKDTTNKYSNKVFKEHEFFLGVSLDSKKIAAKAKDMASDSISRQYGV